MVITDTRQALAARAPHAAVEGGLALAAALVCAGAVVMAAAGAPAGEAFGRGLFELLTVGTPLAAGLYALRARASAGYGVALLAIGCAWSLTALSESSLSVPYTIGRLATWVVFPSVVYLLLAFPSGHVSAGRDRALLAGVVAVAAVLYIGTAPLVAAYPLHTPWATCTTDCPANALLVLDRPPALLDELVLVREWLVELLWAGLFWSMYRRWWAASSLQRPAMAPVFAVATALGLCHIAFHTTRQLGAPAHTVLALGNAWTACIVALSATVLLGLVRRRLLLARALGRLGVALRDSNDLGHVRDALAAAPGDPTTELLIREGDAGQWRDADGRPIAWPAPNGRAITTIGAPDGADDVALIHDVTLSGDRELLDGVRGMVLAGRRNERLVAELGQATHDLEESRRRVAVAADLERARIERDLHDGAQQRLIALRIRLGLIDETLSRDPAGGLEAVHELGFEVERALEELRSLAHGVYPSQLSDGGLPSALRSLAAQAPMPVEVVTDGVTRLPIEIENAVYFTCAEAVQNTLKHAGGATGARIRLGQSPAALEFEVRDDGAGFAAPAAAGGGLQHMRDRIEAIGGRLTVDSRPRRGTCVRGRVPL